MKKIFALIDCNSFYCSCERVFRADLKTKPIVVLSNNDGCVIARTQEAKNMGIADQTVTAVGVIETSTVSFAKGVALAAIGEAMVIFGAWKPNRTLSDAGAIMAK